MATRLKTTTDSGALRSEWRSGHNSLPVARYIDPDFAKLEAEKLWPHVWQMACRLDELRTAGSYVTYNVADQSVFVVRTDDNSIKAYHNVCPHRATALAAGSGRFQLGTITCPFHGWKWNLNGESTFVLDREEFCDGHLSDDYLRLHECKVATWMGSVWINMDPEATPFEDHIAPIKELIDPILIDQMHFYWHKSSLVPANWKVTQEAFMEAYHVPGTHPQLLRKDEDLFLFNRAIEYQTYENGHGIFEHKISARMGQMSEEDAKATSIEDQIKELIFTMRQTFDQHDAMVLKEEVDVAEKLLETGIPEGTTVGAEYQRLVRELYDSEKRPMATPEALMRVTDCHIFPNITFLPLYGNVLMYRTRPTPDNDPDWCIFDMYSLRTYPEGQDVPAWQTEECNDLANADQFRLVPRQDFKNVPRQQRGMHSRAIESIILSERQEKIVLNMHREVDSYLSR